MSVFKESMTASECVYENMKEYSAYTIKSKFPNTIDGLKPIHRRIILSLHRNPGKAKEATVAGRVMEQHPHGDASISDAISKLAQPFSNIAPLVYSGGNVGTYHGEDPAAARYLDVCESDIANDLFFNNTDMKALKYVACESEKGVEPANFVPIIPTALIFPVLGIGFGYKTETSAISLKNACEIAIKFVEMKFKDPDGYKRKLSSLSKYLVPDFPSYCVIRNADQVVAMYKKGDYSFPFVIDGIMEISKDSISVVTLPPDRSYCKVTHDAGTEAIQDKTSWLHAHFQDMADLADKKQGISRGNYFCTLRRGENPFEVLAMFKKSLQFTSTWRPSRLYCDDESGMTEETPISLIEKWADSRYKVVLGGLKQRLIDLQEQYRKLMALVIIVDHAKDVCDLFIKSKDEEATVDTLVRTYNLSPFQARYLQTLPLKRLTAKGKTELLAEIEDIRVKNRSLQERFTKVADEIVATIKTFASKYASKYPPKCVSPTYIGTACYKDTGWIMLESLKECDQILSRFESDHIKFDLFQEDGMTTIVGTDEPSVDPEVEAPKYLHASYVTKSHGKLPYLSIHLKGGCFFAKHPASSGIIGNRPIPVGSRCSVIYKKEGRKITEVVKSITRGTVNYPNPSLKGALYASPILDDDIVVIHVNTKINGVVYVDRMIGEGAISSSVIGSTIVVGVYKANKPILFSVPTEVANRTAIKHIYIDDITALVTPNTTMKILLTKKRTSTDVGLSPLFTHSSIYQIKQQ